MVGRALPAGLAIVALVATASGSPRLGFYALLAAVPAAAVAALGAYGDALEGLCGGWRPLLTALALALLVAACASRGTGLAPAALVASLFVYGLYALTSAVTGPPA